MTEEARNKERLLWALQERAKELSCLYEIEELLNAPERPLEDVFRGVIRALPPGWQYPDICQAKIVHQGETFCSDGFVDTPWVQSADIVVHERVVGTISVSYREEMPQADQGPFLQEEGKLIQTIAERLGHFILHQQLRALSQDWRKAQEMLSERGTKEWRFALNLLRRTDQDLFVRISHKMANHLSWSGVAEAQTLLHGFGEEHFENGSAVGEKNQPSPRLPLSYSLELADRVMTLAAAYLPDDEILSRIQRWIHEDRASFLVKTVTNPQSTPGEIADAIRRYQHIAPEGRGLSEPTLTAVRNALFRRFLSHEPRFVRRAQEYISLGDMLGLLERLICLPWSHGRVGGKGAGLFLANQALKKVAKSYPDLGEVRVPKTWYVASDALLAFIRYNNLEEVYEQKYKDVAQVRLEYPNLVQVFKNSQFPPEFVKGLSVALDDLGESPLIVRSSSLLEDRMGAAFSGKYKSLFLANRGSKQERLAGLLDAIAEVYASIFSPDPIQYRAERELLEFEEEMGILIQEVVGSPVGKYFFPAYAGVAVSHNEFRWSPRIKREDGLIRMVPGLGTRAVDRLGDDYPVLVAPGQPGLRVNLTPDEVVRYSPQHIDVINVENGSLETHGLRALFRECGELFPVLSKVVSVREDDRITRPPKVLLDTLRGDLVVTFEGLITDTPFVRHVAAILCALSERLEHPVEIEFASDGTDFFLLQCRPQSHTLGSVSAVLPKDIPVDRVLFTANRYVSNGQVPEITHVVYVDPDRYNGLSEMSHLLAVGRAVSRLNIILPKRKFILMGPGRWGSRGDIKLGVHVTYSDINNTAMLVEIARKRAGFVPDLSFGTHFFQDLVEASIRFLPLYPDDKGTVFNERFFLGSPNELASLAPEFEFLADTIRVIDVARASGGMALRVLMNADQERAVGMLAEPGTGVEGVEKATGAAEGPQKDHWRWRLRMVERLAGEFDASRFGVVGLYLIGSTKNATAGPASDIDLLVHFRGTEEQREALELWFEGWSLCLGEMNYLRTGERTGGLLDVHFVSDEDVAKRSSYAIKIGAVTDAARPLSLKRSG